MVIKMAKLTQPNLTIKLNSDNNKKRDVRASVTLTLTNAEKQLLQQFPGSKVRVSCKLYGKDVGEDSGLNGGDDPLEITLLYSDTTKSELLHFDWAGSRAVDSDLLDEDDQFQDEIVAKFSAKFKNLPVIANPIIPVQSPKVSGSF
jgi:dihydroorotase